MVQMRSANGISRFTPSFRANTGLIVLLVVFSILMPDTASAASKRIVGRVEKAWIEEANVVLRAKIDTGARTSSLDARNISVFRRKNEDWVRFTFTDDANRPVTLERKVVRFAKLKQNARGAELRPVILLGVCIGDIYRITQVNLVKRTRFAYKMLVGRRFLFGHALVDVARQYTSEPKCKEMKSG